MFLAAVGPDPLAEGPHVFRVANSEAKKSCERRLRAAIVRRPRRDGARPHRLAIPASRTTRVVPKDELLSPIAFFFWLVRKRVLWLLGSPSVPTVAIASTW